jgi:hypothetical protein
MNNNMKKQMYKMRQEGNRLIDLINDLPNDITMIEIGCYAGESMDLFMASGKIKHYYAVDIWSVPDRLVDTLNTTKSIEKSVYENIAIAEKLFDEKASKYQNLTKLKMNIKEALKHLPKVDFIYIDGDHCFEAVDFDIKYAKKRIKRGGLIGGHDYHKGFGGVVRAVDSHFPDVEKKKYKDTSWLIKL